MRWEDVSNCTVYIDESGDLGINRGTHWFVLSAVVVDKKDEPDIRAKMNQIKARLNIQQIHMKAIRNFYRRAFVVRELNDEKFTYTNVLVDTTKFDTSKIPSQWIAYNYVCKYLLQRVSWFMNETGRVGDIVLSSRGTSYDNDLIQYISDKLLPYYGNQIHQSVFGNVTAMSAGSWDLLQLADVCATTTFLTYEEHPRFGFCQPCFSLALNNHLYRHNGKVDSYGIKFFQNNMRPDIAELRSKRICAQKERTPGATAT